MDSLTCSNESERMPRSCVVSMVSESDVMQSLGEVEDPEMKQFGEDAEVSRATTVLVDRVG